MLIPPEQNFSMANRENKTYDNVLYSNSNLVVEKVNKGFYKQWIKCDSKPEYLIHAANSGTNNKYHELYAIDHSNFYMRLCCPSSYPTEISIFEGYSTPMEKRLVARFLRRSDTFCYRPISPCKCCCFQEIIAQHSDGRELGSTKEDCWLFHPSFHVLDRNRNRTYVLSPPVCCMGICIDVSAFDCCFDCQSPMFVFPPNTSNTKGKETGKMKRLFPGAFNECCSGSTKEYIEFPEGLDSDAKIQLLGSMFLLNNVYFVPCRPLNLLFAAAKIECISDCILSCLASVIIDIDAYISSRELDASRTASVDDSFSSKAGLVQMQQK